MPKRVTSSGALATYTKGGNKWVFGGEYLQRYNPYKENRIPTAQFTAEGGFYYNFLSDARKIFSSISAVRHSPDMKR